MCGLFPSHDPDIALDDFNNFTAIFEPYLVTLTTRLEWHQYIDLVVNPHMNKSPNADNYGYFTATNPLTSEVWQLYLFGIDYNPKTNDAKMRFIKKNPDW